MKTITVIVLMLIFTNQLFTQPLRKIDTYLSNKAIPSVAKNYYYNKISPKDNKQTQQIIDSLNTSNNNTRPFYILVVSKMLKNADGALGETLGLYCKSFIENNPNHLINFFYAPTTQSKKEAIQLWAKIIAQEFEIDCESNELKCIEQSLQYALSKCSAANKPLLKTIYNGIKKEIK